MNGWLALALVVAGLVFVALIVLLFDVLRGDVGGGHHTMQRARRLLVIATDPEMEAGAMEWIAERRRERADLQCFVLAEHEGQTLDLAIEEAIARERPDAVVVARHATDNPSLLEGVYGRLKEDCPLPVDAIYVGPDGVR